ncbi:tetratricopeptide repeat protein [Fluviicola chungangensis]|jgi:predicted negative regulator of RcsB-dependent stress response|uniref:Tetratricopeptide repeat protein n=1 Tax=Fluviicola chungangensis TaxID=2597671 RepID=A0A556N7Q0_9FLAO|nr:tetratricopeptide repeat protein [Fluviicola chungangensis]TSJ48202.1 tetratricopeptide repeat protein [Fluviicola chungangensis]
MAGTTSFNDIKRQFKENKRLRMITFAVVGLIVGILGYILYKQFVYAPNNQKANEGYYRGLNLAAKDSVDAAIAELEPFVKKNDGYQGGEVAEFTLARQYMAKGDFQKALKLLEGVKLKDTYGPAMALGLQGDCYSELGKYKDAMELYIDAAEVNENEWTTPTYLFKAGQVAEEIKDYAKAKELYERINQDYYMFGQQKTIDKYIARVSNK